MAKSQKYAGVVDLGQGKPDFPGAENARLAAAEAVLGDKFEGKSNQYSAVVGHKQLLDALCEFHLKQYNWQLQSNNFLVTCSGTQALNTLCQSTLDDGDEVIVVAPLF